MENPLDFALVLEGREWKTVKACPLALRQIADLRELDARVKVLEKEKAMEQKPTTVADYQQAVREYNAACDKLLEVWDRLPLSERDGVRPPDDVFDE